MTSAGGASPKPKKLDEMFVNDLLGLRSKLAAAFSQELCLNYYLTVSILNDAVCRRLIQCYSPICLSDLDENLDFL